jgi:hypothetical protein
MNEPPQPTQRVSAIPLPDRYALPARPEDARARVQDAYRQATFVLGPDLRLFEEGMNLQLRIVHDASGSAFRTHPYAALMGLWSRVYLALADACLLATRGSYASCPNLVRAACEQIAAQQQLAHGELPAFLEWLASNLASNEQYKAFEFGLGRYFAGEALAADTRLRSVYRPASELGRPSFGATLLQAGPESNSQRLALTFADASFHLGWAEIVLGWLLALGERQLAIAVHAGEILPIQNHVHEAYADYARRVESALARGDRCSVEEIEEGPRKRLLVHNFRRQPGAAPKRILL